MDLSSVFTKNWVRRPHKIVDLSNPAAPAYLPIACSRHSAQSTVKGLVVLTP